MTSIDESHVYERALQVDKRTSLALLVGMVNSGSSVLDVGIGGGALGAYLRQSKNCVVDGLTYNAEEAALAGTNYRSIHVADLDISRVSDWFGSQRYDCVVCADVLEHLRDPGRVLDDARQLLAEGGKLLISVPNVAYAGLIAELLGGEFSYRREGLLDQTHVRFFTRNSLLRFLAEHGWRVKRIETVELDLADSEFAPALDALSPAVRTQLMANPDGATYQFVMEVEPCPPGVLTDHSEHLHDSVQAMAHYVLQLYCADAHGYNELHKVPGRARIAQQRQRVVFALPDMDLHGLRLDPSERPGFMHLYEIHLCDRAGIALWQWDGDIGQLQNRCHQVVLSAAGLGFDTGAVLMVGDDPQIQLPIAAECLARARGGHLSVTLSWPMSADYRVLAQGAAHEIGKGQDQLRLVRNELESAQDQIQQQKLDLHELETQCQSLGDAHGACNVLTVSLNEVEARHAALNNSYSALCDEHVRTRRELIGMADSLAHMQELATRSLAARDDMARQMDEIQNSTIFRVTRPLVRAKTWLDARLHGGSSPEHSASDVRPVPLADVVDIVVPVYRSLSDTRCCVESVLSAPNKTPFRLVVINDCSPEPDVTAYLRTMAARDARVLLLENEVNLGFVGTVNRGMALDDLRDVLLLNSDAEVANDWLDRMRAAAYSVPRISSVTPLSNNATICSYPRFCEANELPRECDTAALDALCREVNPGKIVDVPTGVGFCMYIRRESLKQVGLFDVENFGKGYGEENDFCMRSANVGWRHLLLLDTFVRHAGGVSFGDAKTPREREAVEKLRRLHPSYDARVHDHVVADPARLDRLRIDLARIRALALPSVLFVTHSRGGGTERHVQELAQILHSRALCFALKPTPAGTTELSWVRSGEAFKLEFRLPTDMDVLVNTLRALGVAHVHIHHLIGHDPCVWGISERLGVRFDYTVHDFYAVCPQISLTDSTDRYCGEQGLDQCQSCLQRTPAPGGVQIIEWRQNFSTVLNQARFVLTPSQDAGQRIRRYIPDAAIRVVPHKDLAQECVHPSPAVTGNRPLRIVVIGALSPIKGADIVEAVAKLAANQATPCEIHLLGYAYRPLLTQPKACLTVHGAYEEADLDALLNWLKPDVAWFPAQWPETYSYTLSACLKAALPVVVPDIGAFAERIADRPWSWVIPWGATASECLEFFTTIRARHFQQGVPPPVSHPVQGLPASFDYLSDYMDRIIPRISLPTVPDDVLMRHSGSRRAGLTAIGYRARGRALSAVVRVRNHSAMRSVVRWVPLRWQTRLKLWLLK
jgi:GT2 family glycosyltransferase/2-polyprenyl-3-methyl-5-hydroxy-6-metoxy-1,4-benzoquinol methylase/glycosyltransferase involved in cell wall biosynthesis